MKSKRKIFKNEYIFSIISRIITIIISMFHSVFLVRFLGSELQGNYTYINSITSVLAIIITFGMHQAYPYFRMKMGKDNIYDLYLSIVTSLFTIYLILAAVLSTNLQVSLEMRIVILLTPVTAYADVLQYVTLIESPNKRNVINTLIVLLETCWALIMLVFAERSYDWMVFTLFFPCALKSFSYLLLLKFRFKIDKMSYKLFINMVKFGFLPMIALLLTTLNYKIDVLMLKTYDFISPSMIGVYSIGMMFADKIALIPDTLKGVMASRLAKGAGTGEVARVCRMCFGANICMLFILIITGPYLIKLLYGHEYEGAYFVLIICAIGSVFVGYFKLIAQYNIINKKQWINIVLLIGSILVNVLLNYLLIPKYKLNGAAFASGVGYFLTGIIFVIWFAKSNGIPINKMFILQQGDILNLKGE